MESACRGIQLLPGSSPASGYIAKPLSFDISNGQTVYNYTLYEKQENKRQCRSTSTALNERRRAKAQKSPRVDLTQCAGQLRNAPEPLHH